MKKGLCGISIATMTILYGLLAVILIVVFEILKLPVWLGIGGAFAVLIVQFLISPFLTDLSMKFFYKADFSYDPPLDLKNFIEQVCLENNMKYPKIGYINDSAPNAFTYGRTKNDARIVFTKGILERLNKEEVKSVISHEIGHACHYDMLLMTMIQLVPFVFYAITRFCLATTRSSSNNKVRRTTSSKGDSDSNGILAIIALVSFILYVITQYIILWFSRSREYYADSFSVKSTKNPNALASALVKIGLGLSITEKPKKQKVSISEKSVLGISDTKSSHSIIASSVGVDGEISTKNIKNAMKWDLWNKWAKWYELNSTHPLVSKRILAICEYSKEYGQTPYIEFDEEKPKSCSRLFPKELLMIILPWVGILATISLVVVSLAKKMPLLFMIAGAVGCISMLLSLFRYSYSHPKKFKKEDISNLLSNIDVSGVTSIPCELEGQLIGRGDPGCLFNENFVLQDKSGIILLNYKQPLKTLNKIFAIFRSKNYIGKKVKVIGWYRRTPVPFIDMLSFEVNGEVKKLYSYITGYVIRIIFLVAFAIMPILTNSINWN